MHLGRVAAAALVTAAALSGAHHAGGATTGAEQVALQDIAFSPSVVRIREGRRATWTWRDRYSSHNIHSVGRPRFAGATERRTGTHSVRFTRQGTYRYTCTLHPGMNGRIVVR